MNPPRRKGSRSTNEGLAAVVLAAGKGTRMRSRTAKVLHPLCGRPLGAWSIEAAREAGADPIVVVVGHQAELVEAAMTAASPKARLEFAIQEEQNGTGHAVLCAWDHIARSNAARTLILCGDVPSLSASTLKGLAKAGKSADIALLTFVTEEPGSYGRIVRDGAGRVTAIVEAKDATSSMKQIREVNAGIYCVKTTFLGEALKNLRADNAQNELYLTDLVAMAASSGRSVIALSAPEHEVEGVNDRVDLSRAAARIRARINEKLMRSGVSFEDPSVTYVDADVAVSSDVFLAAGVHLTGATRVGRGATIGAYSSLHDASVGPGAFVKEHTVVDSAVIGPDAHAGPFARLRPGTVLEADARVGNFVETKKARLRKGVKAGHLSYLGDADIGAGANIGAGTITCNYDGSGKHLTIIGKGAFIGSNTALVAPVKVGRGAYVGAGSTVTLDVPDEALGVARAKQRNLEGWAHRRNGATNDQNEANASKSEMPSKRR